MEVALLELWNRLEAYFAERWPHKELRLRPPATEAQIEAAEAELGVRFPADFRDSLRVHDGQDDEASIQWLPHAKQLFPLASMVECWRQDRRHFHPETEAHFEPDPTGRVRQCPFQPKHVSVAGYDDRLILDFGPGPSGSPGQVIIKWDISHIYLTRTWRRMMCVLVEGLEDGTIVMREEGAAMSHLLTPQWLSPRARKSIPMLRYFERATRGGA